MRPIPIWVGLALAACTGTPQNGDSESDTLATGTIASAAQTDPAPGPDPTPSPPPQVSVSHNGPTAIMVKYQCNGWVQRTDPTGDIVNVSNVCNAQQKLQGFGMRLDDTVQPGTEYCYVAFNNDGLNSPPDCLTTPWAPYVFNGPGLTQAESDQMVASFDWSHTEVLGENVNAPDGSTIPALYSMNILIQTEDDLRYLRGIGIHTQTKPLFADEQVTWNGEIMMANVAGAPVGSWIAAIVPGAVYNEIRRRAIIGINSGHPIGIRAIVFRKVHVAEASIFPQLPDLAALNPTYLAQQGLPYNADSIASCDPGPPRTCSVVQALGASWLVRKFVNFAIDVVVDAYHVVQHIFGTVEKIFREDLDVTITVTVNNSDPKFSNGSELTSGWNGTPLKLSHVTLKVYQGHFAEYSDTTDSNGTAHLTLLSHLGGKVCVMLDNNHVVLIDSILPREVCIGNFGPLGSQNSVELQTDDWYVNELLAMTDAHDYVKTVMGHDVDKISVLTGWVSNRFTQFNDGRSFAPCLGRFPNIAAGLNLNPAGALLNEITQFIMSYDIVMAKADLQSRGVGVHEYGHAAMCDIMRSIDHEKASQAWTQVMTASVANNSDPQSQPRVLAEAFADFVALQVVGGTNYFAGANTEASLGMHYCKGDSTNVTDCVETNSMRCVGPGCVLADNVRWAASVLQDAFDRFPAAGPANPPRDQPNDGSHWQLVNNALVPHHAANQVSSTDSDTIELPGPSVRTLIDRWFYFSGDFSYQSFFGGLAQTIAASGASRTAACAMFKAHEPGGVCPSYFENAAGATWSDVSVLDGQPIIAVGATRGPDGRLHLFGTDPSGQIWHRFQGVANGDWEPWQMIEGHLHNLAAEVTQDGRLEIVGTSAKHNLWYCTEMQPGSDVFNSCQLLGSGYRQAVVTKNPVDGSLHLFAINVTSDTVFDASQAGPNGTWSPLSSFGGTIQNLAGAANADGRLELYATADGDTVYRRVQDATGAWGQWTLVSGWSLHTVAMARNLDGRLELFGINSQSTLLHTAQVTAGASTNYASPISLGGPIWSTLAAAANTDGRIEIFGSDTTPTAQHIWQLHPNGE